MSEDVVTRAEPDWEGRNIRSCGDHRSTGDRAWCHSCAEWCYPADGCFGCKCPDGVDAVIEERDKLAAEIVQLREKLIDAELTIRGGQIHSWMEAHDAGDPIEVYTFLQMTELEWCKFQTDPREFVRQKLFGGES